MKTRRESLANRPEIKSLVLILGLSFGLFGCAELGDSPTAPDPGGAGDLNPEDGLVALKSVPMEAPDGTVIPISLMGGELAVLDDGQTVTLDVALRNDGHMPIEAPLILWIGDFSPDTVVLLNPDTTTDSDPMLYGFDYSALLGDDGILYPGESTDVRQWQFQVPGLTAFSFGGEADGGFGPSAAILGGLVFDDFDRDGEFDPEEVPLEQVPLTITFPDGTLVWAMTDADGTFQVPAAEPGLYEIRVDLPFADGTYPPDGSWYGPVVTTPNPLFVTLVPGPDGRPLDYWDALFGIAEPEYDDDPWAQPIAFTPLTPLELQLYHWSFTSAWLEGDHGLKVSAGFNGCAPGHPFVLYLSGAMTAPTPTESGRATLVLVNEMESFDCGWGEQDMLFDIGPLYEQFLAQYGAGSLELDIVDFNGAVIASVPTYVDWHMP